MNSSTFSEKILQKLSDMDSELESVYESAAAIKNLKIILENQQKKEKKFFDDFSINMNNLEENRKQSYALISELQKSKNELKIEINLILDTYQEQQNNTEAALTVLNTQKTNNESLQQQITQAFSGLDSDIETRLEEFKKILEYEIESIRPELELKVNEAINGINIESKKSLSDFKVEKNNLIQDITQFKNKIDSEFRKTTDLFNTQTNTILSDFFLEKDTVVKSFAQFKDNLSQDIFNLKATIVRDLGIFEESKNQEIHQKIQKVEKGLNQTIEARLDKIAEEQSSFLERQNVLTQRQNITIENLTLQLKSLERAYEQEKLKNADTIKQIIEAINKTTQELNGYVYREAVTNVDKKFENLKKEIEETYKKKGLFG